MSYILDALKKAEQERQIGQVPGLASQHERAAVVGGGRWTWALLAVLLVNAVLLVYALWPDSGSRSGDAGVLVEEPPALADPPRIAQRPAPRVVPPVARSVSEPVATAPRAVAHPPARVVEEPPLRELPAEPEPMALVEPEPEPETLRPLPPVPVRPRASDPDPAAAAPPPVRAAAEGANLPVWPRIPGQLFRQINNDLRLDVHVYSDQPQERFVLINMLKYGEGDQLQEGPVVDAITSDGVTLSFRGQRFQMRPQ